MTKGTKCTFGGKKTLCPGTKLQKQLCHRKTLEILHKKYMFWPDYHVKSSFLRKVRAAPIGFLDPNHLYAIPCFLAAK
jgi:hypothetical protein